jgi:hypothetical protein
VLIVSSRFSGSEQQLVDNCSRLVTRHPDEIHPHPIYVRHHITVHVRQLSAVAELGDLAFREPLSITRENVILDGLARWTLARQRHMPTLACIEYEMSEAEAIQYLLQRHLRSSGLNDFVRICLALELEPDLKEKARVKQQTGGRNKGSPNLTEDGRLDVRKEIARVAGASVGNVSKVKQLITTAHPDIIQALRERELFIHRAWSWIKLSQEEQREKLFQNRSKRGVARTIRNLISAHVRKSWPVAAQSIDLTQFASALQSGKLGSVTVVSINIPGKAIFVTEELLRAFEAQKELAVTCDTNNLSNKS